VCEKEKLGSGSGGEGRVGQRDQYRGNVPTSGNQDQLGSQSEAMSQDQGRADVLCNRSSIAHQTDHVHHEDHCICILDVLFDLVAQPRVPREVDQPDRLGPGWVVG
jgi:hypothetical protein